MLLLPKMSHLILGILFYWGTVVSAASSFQPISQPSLQYSEFGNQIGFFGSFDAISFYSYANASSLGTSSSNSTKLYLRDPSNNNQIILATLDGNINQLLQVSSDTIAINGNYTQINGQSVNGPIIYNITDNSVSPIIPSNSKRDGSSLNGNVSTIYVDNSLIYLGGDFEFNNTYGAAIYDTKSNLLSSTPFQGFGKNSKVNAISKIFNDEQNEGSIIFGGQFNTLGLKDLLVHNTTSNSTRLNHSNSTNTSLINAEQIISLRHGTFSNVNSDGLAPDSSLICPAKTVDWSVTAGQGGQWLVELPDEMKGLTPTKARLTLPQGNDATKTFRIYSYPNNGIMNLSYVDPETNDIKYCDAWCPLLTLDKIQDITSSNSKNATELSDDDTVYVDENGSYSIYYDPSTKTKSLGYGADYQEFAFENEVKIDKVGVTIIDWYGSKGVLSGFQLFLDAITVYGNESLNEPNCNEENPDAEENSSHADQGSFQSVKSLNSAVSGTDYLVSVGTDAKMTLYPNISYTGNYSIIMNTPGCIADNSCPQRSIANVTVIDNEENQLSTKLIYQNNDYYKFDYLYYGPLNGTSENSGLNRIEISYHDVIIPDTQDPWLVVDKFTANIVSLDKYYDRNNSNSTRRRQSNEAELTYIDINGLFEYSLANFSNFDQNLVSHSENNKTIISRNNKFVGNSSINLLSGQLSNDTVIDQIRLFNGSSDSSTLLLLGNFESNSKNLTLPSNNLITLGIKSYNTTSNETETQIQSNLKSKRDDETSIFGAEFNTSVSNIVSFNQDLVFLGDFSLSNGGDNSIKLNNLSLQNGSVSSINNFALYSNDNQWYGFGNNFIDSDYDQFTNVSIDNSEFLIFSSDSSNYKVWNSSNSTWADSSNYQLNVSQILNLDANQQVLSGSSFKIMDFYGADQAYSASNDSFDAYNINIERSSNTASKFTNSYYVNNSLSIVAGDFESGSVSKLGLISNNKPNTSISELNGNFSWSTDSNIQTLYVDSNNHYLFVGFNGTVEINNSSNLTGLFIYDLKNNSIAPFQPSQLSTSDEGKDLKINSIVLYDQGDRLLVGGNFDQAGSLDCVGMCIYDIANTRWINPQSVNSNNNETVAGEISEIKFYQSNQVLISGNLTVNGAFANFITYNFDSGEISTKSSFNKLGSSKLILKFIINDSDDNDLNARMVAYGSDFISGYDGNKWSSIDQEINFDSNTRFNDLKLIQLAKSNNNNNGTYFDKDNILVLAGKFNLTNYGMVNAALYNGSNWNPYVYTTTSTNQIGEIRSLLILDSYRFQSSDDINNKSNKLSKGKVVGISLACALGSTTLLGLLYIIPYFALFRKSLGENDVNHQRIQENDMMDAVNPEDLFHEIDLQRNQ